MIQRAIHWSGVIVLALAVSACGKNTPPVARPTPPPPAMPSDTTSRPPSPPAPVAEPMVVPAEPVPAEEDLNARDLEQLNRDSPLRAALFAYDSSELDSAAQAALNADAELLKRYSSWMVTIEGHADERGTAEYNLALGERRALAARNYLVALGIAADRLRTISYGKEFPFDPGHTEEAWAKNRRAHFVITAK